MVGVTYPFNVMDFYLSVSRALFYSSMELGRISQTDTFPLGSPFISVELNMSNAGLVGFSTLDSSRCLAKAL